MKFLTHLFIAIFFCLYPMTTLADEAEPLVLVMGEDSYPYQFVDERGEAQGILVDLWLEWARQTDKPIMFVSRHWTDALDQLSDGNADIHIGMAATPARKTLFAFSEAISHVSTYLYLHHEIPAGVDVSMLEPYQVGIVAGSSHEADLLALSPRIIFKRYKNRHDLLQAVLNSEVKVFAGMDGYLRDKQVNKQIVGLFPLSNRILIKKIPLRPAVNHGNQSLLVEINLGFASIDKARLDAIEERWLGINRQQTGIKIATAINLEPFISVGGDKHLHGLYVDLWNLWSDKTGIPISFVTGDMNQSLDMVKSGQADVHIGYPESEKFKTGLLRSQLLYQVKSRLHSYGEPIADLNSLAGKRVGAVPTAPYLAELKQAMPNVQLKLYDSVTAMIEAAKDGHIGSFVASASWTHHYLVLNDVWSQFYAYPDLEFVTDIYVLTNHTSPGLSKRIKAGFELIDFQEFKEIERKWILNARDRIFDAQMNSLSFSQEQEAYLQSLSSLRIGYLKAWKPMEFTNDKGAFSGINSDVARVITTQLGLKMEAIEFDEWQSLIDALINGDVDIAGSVAETAERRKQLLFSEPYWPSPWALATPINTSVIFNLQELSGQRLAIVEGYELVRKLMGADYGIELVLVADPRAGLKAVMNGKADAFVDKTINMAAELKLGEYEHVKMSVLADFSDQHSHFGVHPSRAELIPLMNMAIDTINQGSREVIYQNWIETLPPLNQDSQVFKWCIAVIIILLLLIGGLFLFRFAMSKERRKRKQLENKLNELTHFDPLTGFPNRSLLDDRLEQSVLLHCREQATFSVLFIDVSGFKKVNKELGHKAGDDLLKIVAVELKSCFRRSDTLARFGSNEFVAILNKTKDLDLVCQVADTILSHLSQTFEHKGIKLTVSASIGIAMYPADGDNVVELLKSADKLMYRAKQSGGNCYKSS
ncbi:MULTISPECIES: transporter substrate-binding domain-containing protein [Shewanella]|nr:MULTISPECIES: transporter substrate-binding domain-containing protein [Shewanella]